MFHEIFDVFLNEILDLLLSLGVSLGFLGDLSAMFYHVLECLLALLGKVLHGEILGQVLDVGVDYCLELLGGFLEQIGDARFSFKLRVKKKKKLVENTSLKNVNDVL